MENKNKKIHDENRKYKDDLKVKYESIEEQAKR